MSDPLPWNKIKTDSIRERAGTVRKEALARPIGVGASIADFFESLPQRLAANDLRASVAAVVQAHRQNKKIVWAVGAHVIRVGLSPILIDLMERGLVSAIALDGAGILHDFEMALIGQTPEEVAVEGDDGRFCVAEETATSLNDAIAMSAAHGIGIGQGVGRTILKQPLPHTQCSLLATAVRLNIPVTAHVAIGADSIHIHPSASGPALGEAAMADFRLFTKTVAALEGGVYFSVGAAALLPEVFLNALSVARNLGQVVENFTTVHMDVFQHDRPLANGVRRPTQKGPGYTLTGHHEILLPLLAAGILQSLSQSAPTPPATS